MTDPDDLADARCLLLRWLGPQPTAERPFGILEICSGRERSSYFVEPSRDTGLTFLLSKLVKADQAPIYRVILDGKRSRCDCPGHSQRGTCKHLIALRLLHRHGRLPS
jgi:hypothetical protein